MQVPYAPMPARLGPYELLQKLATGGMAEIYVARRVGPHGFSKRIAVKRILPQLAADPEFVAMFIDEARLCAQLSHPNLVQVFDFGEEGCELYMAMELVEGTTAAKVVRTANSRGESVPTDVAMHIALSVGRGLAHAHDTCDEEGTPLGLVHRDVSPGNILISNTGAVKLGDFGIARAAEFDRRTDQGQLKGKLGYMSPEQVTGRELDAKSDQFTAAIVLAELLTARPLFSGGREMDVLVKIRDADISMLEKNAGHVPVELMAVLRRALSRRREQRFPTTSAYADALEDVISRRGLGARPATLVDWLVRVGLIKGPGKSGEYAIEIAPSVGEEKGHKPSGAQLVAALHHATLESLPPTQAAPSVYRVQLPNVPGALALSDVAELFASGQILGDTHVSRNNGPFRPAREFDELACLSGGIKAVGAEALATITNLMGPLGHGELPGRLFELAVRRATGKLTVKNGAREKKVFFADGVPEVTLSNDDSERLGVFLVARGLAVPMEVEMALAMSPRHGGRLGDALVSLGILRPVELMRAVVDQMRDRFVELVGWKSGELSFAEGERCPDDDTMPDALNAVELISRGVALGYSGQDLAELLASLESSLIVPVPRAAVSVASLKLAPREAAVLESIGGGHSLGRIARDNVARGTASVESVRRAVFVGLSSGAFVSPGWPLVRARESLPTLPLI